MNKRGKSKGRKERAHTHTQHTHTHTHTHTYTHTHTHTQTHNTHTTHTHNTQKHTTHTQTYTHIHIHTRKHRYEARSLLKAGMSIEKGETKGFPWSTQGKEQKETHNNLNKKKVELRACGGTSPPRKSARSHAHEKKQILRPCTRPKTQQLGETSENVARSKETNKQTMGFKHKSLHSRRTINVTTRARSWP